MTEYIPPETQEEFDKRIKDRLQRVRCNERKAVIDSTEVKLRSIIADLIDLYKDLDKMR